MGAVLTHFLKCLEIIVYGITQLAKILKQASEYSVDLPHMKKTLEQEQAPGWELEILVDKAVLSTIPST